MKKRICIPLIIINLIFIIIAIYSKEVYKGAYLTTFFWGFSLYSLITNILVLINNRKLTSFICISGICTLLSVIMFFIYIPKYTPSQAIARISNQPEFEGKTIVLNSEAPTVSSNISLFVKSAYNFTLKEDNDVKILFNPVSGNHYTYNLYENSIILPSEYISDLDISFEEEYNQLAGDDNYGKIELLSRYKNLWNERFDLICNKINEISEKEVLNDFNRYIDNLKEAHSDDEYIIKIITDKHLNDSFATDMAILENQIYRVRTDTLNLERLYDIITD